MSTEVDQAVNGTRPARRRPTRPGGEAPTIPVPPRLPGRRNPRWIALGVIAIMAVLGVLFPLAGITMIAFLLLDILVVRRVPALRRAFG